MSIFSKKTSAEREAIIRRKLVNNELNPIADFFLTIILLIMSPFIWMFAQVHDKIMFKFLNKTWIYNVSWEDPRMDQRVFDLGEDDHIITIASAGCNVLDYIIEGAMVTAVDFNLCQINLTELKKVAILNIEYDQFFEIFSMSNMDLLRELYPTKLRPYLSDVSVEFWDVGIHTVKNFMYSGTSGQMSYLLFKWLFPIFGLDFIDRELARGTRSKELMEMIAKKEYSIRGMAWLMDNILLRGGCCLAGVPERQMALGLHRPNNLAMVIERVFFKTDLVTDNYFYAGYVLGYYTKENCPRYLEEKNYLTMRKYLKQGKLNLIHGTILDAIDQVDVKKNPITVASLLDHMDWMEDRQINQEICHLFSKMDPVRGKIFWRTFADDVHSAPLQWLNPVKVDDYDDRVGMYWTTWIANIKDCPVAYEERVDKNQSKGLLQDLWTGAKVVTFPFWKPIVSSTLKVTGHANEMESFYKYQKDGYDAFREGLLHGKGALMEAMPLQKDGGMTWVDVGGGTARNLEYFTPDVIRKYFSSIYIVDISASLLEVAQERVEAMGLGDIVTIVEADITDAKCLKSLPKAGSVDMVTMSYSFTMIPDQRAAIKNIEKILAKGGHVCIADFFQKGNHDDALPKFSRGIRRLEAAFHKLYFAFDNVHLLSDDNIDLSKNLELIWDNRFRGSVPFIPFMNPYHGILVYKMK
jgi:betaine lipid synthase